MSDINFGANHIKNVNISKRYYSKYKPCKVSLIKMDTNNEKDMRAIDKTAILWENSLTAFVHDDIKKSIRKNNTAEHIQVYALTTQDKNFDKLNPKKILGMMELIDNHANDKKIDVLQTNTDYIFNKKINNKPLYKHIGKKLIQYVKKEFSDKNNIIVHPVKTAVAFYKKMGFRWMESRCYNNEMWIPKKTNQL